MLGQSGYRFCSTQSQWNLRAQGSSLRKGIQCHEYKIRPRTFDHQFQGQTVFLWVGDRGGICLSLIQRGARLSGMRGGTPPPHGEPVAKLPCGGRAWGGDAPCCQAPAVSRTALTLRLSLSPQLFSPLIIKPASPRAASPPGRSLLPKLAFSLSLLHF